jgi:hypothetical protein
MQLQTIFYYCAFSVRSDEFSGTYIFVLRSEMVNYLLAMFVTRKNELSCKFNVIHESDRKVNRVFFANVRKKFFSFIIKSYIGVLIT